MLEGFYGAPWTWEQRRNIIPWLAAHRFNLLVLAPKDDPIHRRKWREPLSEPYRSEISALAREGKSRGVEIGWTLSPGLDLRYKDPSEAETAAAKLRSALDAGARWPVLAFDDTDPRVEQVDFANRVLSLLAIKRPDIRLTFIPAVYWGRQEDSSYLDYLAKGLNPRITVGWTGPSILSREISAQDAARFAKRMERLRLVLGDNYPVQDRLTASGRLFLGPLIGRDPGLSASQAGYLANASPLAYASRLPLATAGTYAFDPDGYDPQAAWERAAAETLREPALIALARDCLSSYLTRPGETPGVFSRFLETCLRGRCRDLERHLRALSGARAAVEVSAPELRRELAPWVEKADAVARAGLDGIELLRSVRSGPAPDAARVERWRSLRQRADASPAVLSELAPDRLFNAVEAALGGHSYPNASIGVLAHRCAENQGPACGELVQALRLLERAPLKSLRDPSKAASLFSGWLRILASRAREARLALEGKPAKSAVRRWLRRWRLLPLMACQARFEEFIAGKEALWAPAVEPPKAMPWILRVRLSFFSRLFPSSFYARMDRALGRGDAGSAASLADELKAMSQELRASGFPVELIPWLDKAAAYGRLAARAAELAEKVQSGGKPTAEEAGRWRKDREDARSGNGLELAVELLMTLDATARWASASPRAGALPVAWPADPSEAL